MKHTKLFLTVLMMALLCAVLALAVYAEGDVTIVDSGTCGSNLTWTLDSEGTLTISGIGAMFNYGTVCDSNNNNEVRSNAPWGIYYKTIYDILINDGITFIGKRAFYGFNALKSVTFGEGLQSVGSNAFFNCTALESVIFGNNLQSIDIYAFYGCSALKSVTFGDGLQSINADAFHNCISLESVTFGNNMQSLDGYAFENCSSLKSVVFGNGLQSIGSFAFYSCPLLESVTFGSQSIAFGDSVFGKCDSLQNIYLSSISAWLNNSDLSWLRNCGVSRKYYFLNGNPLREVVVSNSVKQIPDSAFYSCSTLQTVILSDTVEHIGDYAFAGCNRLANVEISNSVTSIGESAFVNCESLENVTIPNNVTSIGKQAFYRTLVLCNKGSYAASWAERNSPYAYLDGTEEENTISEIVNKKLSYTINKLTRTLTIKNDGSMVSFAASNSNAPWSQYNSYITTAVIQPGCTTVSSKAFKNCPVLKHVVLPEGIELIDSYAFDYCSWLSDITIPDSLKNIGDCAFAHCYKLQTITFGEGIVRIGASAFYGCGLKEVTIPGNVNEIGSSAFYLCDSLKSVTISNGVTSISDSAFSYCRTLSNVTISDSVTYIGSSAFSNCSKLSNVTIGEGLKEIGYCLFYNCKDLVSIVVGGHVRNISSSAFFGCSALEKVILPESVINLEDSAFSNSGLHKIYIRSTNCSIATNAIPYRATIYGHRGGTVEAFADQYGFPFVSLDAGDHDHEFGEWEPHPAATCTEDGLLIRRCEVCGEREEEVLPALGHDYSETVIAPTCTVTGYTTHVCARCGDRYDDTFIDALGHDWQQGDTIDPTCDEDGFTVYRCSRCGVTKQDDFVSALGHNWQQGETVDPTCTAEGYTIYTCERCRNTLWQDFTPMVPHVDEDDDGLCDVCEKRLQYRISENQTIRVAITGGQLSYIRFIPALPGVANITSVSNEDTYGYLFDANMNQIAYNDDGGSGNNFYMTRRMNAGEVYYIGVRYYNSDRSGSFEVRVDFKIDCNHETTEPIPAVEPTCEEFGYTEGVRCAVCGAVMEGQEPIEPLKHDFEEVTRKEPTETETGFIKYACVRCGVTIQKKLPALGHDWQLIEETEPTCENDGYKLYQCAFEDCDETLTETIPALGHTYGEWVVTKEPTCHAVGMTMSACTRCELAKAQYLPMLEHVVVTDAAIEPTCTFYGLTEGSHCILCGDVFTTQEIVQMVPHTEVYFEEVPATCEKEGLTAGVRCSVCKQNLSGFNTIKALGHTVDSPKQPATCCSRAICARCDKEFGAYDLNNHPADKIVVVPAVEPTCTQVGQTEGVTCSVCGKTISGFEQIPMSSHTEGTPANCVDKAICAICKKSYGSLDHNNHQQIVTDASKPATCIETGLTEGSHCAACKKTIKPQETVPLAAHTPKTQSFPETCTEDGYKDRVVCSVCKTLLDRGKVVPAHGHDWDNWRNPAGYDCTKGSEANRICKVCGKQESKMLPPQSHAYAVVSKTDATCTDEGETNYKCTLCGATYSETIPALEHVDKNNDGKCDACKEQMTGGEHCKYCGEVHDGAFGWLVSFFHKILAVFKK